MTDADPSIGIRLRRRVWLPIVGSIAVMVLSLVLYIAWLIVAPDIDERLGIFTERALHTIQSHKVSNVSLREVVDAKFRHVRWRAFHQDEFLKTFVECVGIPRQGGTRKRLLWFVEEVPAWHRWPPFRNVLVTGLNDEAFALAPDLIDPRPGHGVWTVPSRP